MATLLSPLKVKGYRLKNRIVMPPMHTGLATTHGVATSHLIEHYVRRAKALGLLIVEHSYVSIEGKLSKGQLGIYDDALIPELKKLVQGAHDVGTPLVLQINHAGGMTSVETTGKQLVAPSPTETARRLQVKEIGALGVTFAEAAERAIRAGFDGVEVHGAHGFLINQFYSPLTNKRRDKYGGSLVNRMRFPLQVVEKVKQKVGARLLLYRLGSDDMNPAGTQIEDSQEFAARLEEAGVDIIDVSGGLCGSRPANLQGTQGYLIPQAQRIKKVVNVPVIGVGGITDPLFANSVIRDGKVDMVAVGRALLKDADWAVKAVQTLRKR